MAYPHLPGNPRSWSGCQEIHPPQKFQCGWCDLTVSTLLGFQREGGIIRICPNCNCPTLFSASEQWPGPLPTDTVSGLPPDIEPLFAEMRKAAAAGAHTAAVMIARTLLLRVAWQRGAPKSISNFKPAVDWLVAEQHVGKNAQRFLEHIRDSGNSSVHEDILKTSKDSALVAKLLVIILRSLYEGDHLLDQTLTGVGK